MTSHTLVPILCCDAQTTQFLNAGGSYHSDAH
jgi:hypothetical protein